MKILVVTHYYSTHRGGIEIVAGRLAGALGRAHTVVWAASDSDETPRDLDGLVRFLPMRTANAIERITGLPMPVWSPSCVARLRREVRDADVVHLHDFAYFGNASAFVCAALVDTPVLLTQHVGYIPYRSRALRLALRAAHATLGRLVLGQADQVVFISRVVRDYFTRSVHFRSPPLVIANGVDTELFVPAPARGRDRVRVGLGLDPSRPMLLFVGRFVEKKGLHVLRELAHRLTDVSWVFAGWGPLDPREWRAPNIHVFSNRQAAELVPLYHAADLLVLPSVGEGLPLVVQEAMSCGLPAMVGEDTARAVDGPAGLVFPCEVGGTRTADLWERALRHVLDDRPALSALGPQVAAFARRRWSWAGCADAYASLMEQLSRADRRTSSASP